jgi:hypothetical protein
MVGSFRFWVQRLVCLPSGSGHRVKIGRIAAKISLSAAGGLQNSKPYDD